MRMRIVNRPIRRPGLVLAALLSLWLPHLCLGQQMDTIGPLPADGVWRLAGTFNNWHNDDDGYRLTPQADGTLVLQRLFPIGEHGFKFVRNADWNDAHAGCAADDVHRLEQPGNNIPLKVEYHAPIRLTFDPTRRTWSMELAAGDQALPVVQLKTPALAGRGIVIDLSASLPREGRSIVDSRITGPAHVKITRGDAPLLWKARAPWDETVDLEIAVSDGEWSPAQPFALAVAPSFQLQLNHGAEHLLLHPVGDGTHAGVTDPLDAGRYLLAIRDQNFGKLAMRDFDAREGEQLAVRYRPASRTIEATPGRFTTEFDGEMQLRITEVSQPPRHDPRRAAHFRAISLEPPLADVFVYTKDRSTRPALLLPDERTEQMVRVSMRPQPTPEGVRWQARVRFPAPKAVYDVVFCGPGGREQLRRYEVRLQPQVQTPDWAKGAVWYQIFPERFHNGDPGNDPSRIGVLMKDWTSDFYAVPESEFEAWQERTRHFGDDPDRWDRAKVGAGPADGPGRDRLYNVIWDRRYGGDLQGVLDKLDHLESLGVDAIYLNPVFESPTMHKYDTADYRHIDDSFGPADPAGDAAILAAETLDPATWGYTAADRFFINEFLPACKERGMRVIIDGVFNHVGREFWAFLDVREKGIESPYADWFVAEFDDAGALSSWAAWDGRSGWMPDFRETREGNLIPPVKQHIFDITARWLDPNGDGDPSDGVDGWRLDVPEMVGDTFWQQWRRHVKSINPDAYIVAEIWYDASRWLGGDMFDAQMHYPFGSAVVEWINVRPGMRTADMFQRFNAAFDNDPPATQLVQQNLYDSHDTDRLVSQLFNPGREFDAGNRPQDNGPNYNGSRPSGEYFRMARLAVAFQATYLGAPMFFQGDELGMWGADDPANRKPVTWPELLPFQSADEQFLPEHLAHYQRWFNLRRQEPALRYGSVQHLRSGSDRVAAFARHLNDTTLLVVLNAGREPYHLEAEKLVGKGARLEPILGVLEDDQQLSPYHAAVWRVVAD
ncbi:MAG: alpha-amylase family glycosyl hydrolase [Phycisphaerales bacterium JB038]